jgi:GMP synthase-like glutamine amidotransferase
LRVHWLQHAEFEDLGCIAPWLARRGDIVTRTRLYANEALPEANDFDWLIVMGGPMNIYEHALHPWLLTEKALIKSAIEAGKRVLGICLGSQLIADVLGGPVTRNAQQEIGWFPVALNDAGCHARAFSGFPTKFHAFQWHGDTFAMPRGLKCLMSSAACANQAFSQDNAKVVGIQFHLEVTAANARVWFEHEQPAPAAYVQAPTDILREMPRFAENNRLMIRLLENMLQ